MLKVGAAALWVGSGCGGLDLAVPEGASFDAVLDGLHATDPEFRGGLANHAPMAAEALVTLGRSDRVVPFVRRYATRLDELDPASPLPAAERSSALGHEERRAAWIAAYSTEVLERDPRELLARDWPVLAPGYAAAGLHGVLRTAHAIRSLERRDTPSRRRELAHGLGYWAATVRPLPGRPGARVRAGNDVVRALAAVEMVPGSLRRRGFIVDRLGAVEDDPRFVDAVEAVDLDALPVETGIHELAAAAARLFLREGGSSIGYLHAVTGTSALRLILPWLDAPARRDGLGHAFRTVAAIHATFGSRAGVPSAVPPTATREGELVEAAARSSDEHEIKLVEAALREHAVDPRPEFLASAAAWGRR